MADEQQKSAEEMKKNLERVQREVSAWSSVKRENAEALMFQRVQALACAARK
jgi:hypothetical protein